MNTDLRAIERKWQERWEGSGTYNAEPIPGMKKYFVNFPYPYMNGFLHIGHAFSLMRIEILSRFKRMTGHNVLFPFAFHCTGTPIVAAADRIRRGEASQIAILRDMGIPAGDIPRFEDALYWTEFFPREARADLHRLGIGVDWRRAFITTSLNPFYSKFIEWQFRCLREKGYVKKGEYPVVWCPAENAPTGDHARLRGEGERPQEFTLLKFGVDPDGWRERGGASIGDGVSPRDGSSPMSRSPPEDSTPPDLPVFLLAATLRPETVFGQTNLWVDPGVEYALALHTDPRGTRELWVLSEQAVAKLLEQKKTLERIGTMKGRDLIGLRVLAPAIHRMIPVLPSHFCDPARGTGIVTSVPSDAPDDWMGLFDLQNDPAGCARYGLDPAEVKAIRPIPIIESADLGTNSAVKLCEAMGIENQFDREKLEKAKHEIYKQGFYSGTMTDHCGAYAGRPVEQVKDEVKAMLLGNGEADLMYELTGEVICRCLTPCLVKIVDDQWFITYSNPGWKREVHQTLDRMELFPENVRKQFHHVIDWLNDWACTRELGLGTPLPWETKWLIESLSDSTIYMAYYTISGYLENGVVPDPAALDHEFFDHIFRGNGDGEVIARRAGITPETLERMRREFLYWYPYEIRGSGKDLIQNHLTFCIFTHTAVWGPDLAPKGFTVNGWMKVGGEKMSKSAGNFHTLREVMDIHGTDVVRLTLGQAGEGLEDPNWEEEFAAGAGKRLAQWLEFATDNYTASPDHRPFTDLDVWFRSRLHGQIGETREQMELMNFRSALKTGYFDLQNAFKRYLNRSTAPPHPVLVNEFIEVQTLLLAPYVPHIAEEIWENIGKDGSVVFAPYPESDPHLVSEEAERREEHLIRTVEDIRKIIRVTRIEPARIVLYTSPDWKYLIFRSVVGSGTYDSGSLMKTFMQDPEFRKHGKEVNAYIVRLVKDRPTYAPSFDEYGMLRENAEYLSREFHCRVEVFRAGDPERYDPSGKAHVALPYKPGIFIE